MSDVPAEPIGVLDVDLDAFLDGIAHSKTGSSRLDASAYFPWSETKLRNFLEVQCGLSRDCLIPGEFIEEHHQALGYFERLFQQHGPISVTHVDAHADLGFGGPAWKYIITEYLRQPVRNRVAPSSGTNRLHQGNYLAYALANRMLARLTYVHHPEGGTDCIAQYFRDNDPDSGFVEMRLYPLSVVNRALDRMDSPDPNEATAIEPPVPFTKVSTDNFHSSERFKAAVLCQSPGYTPETSDALIPIFAEYIDFGPTLPSNV
ncbi:UPF0489 family protein [Bradyrhizobium sp. WYCCWR 12699]|uniref:UPF0489 family protein n=1 Tax=Bradyrhizobium sp. WYCCWR 12699 TaxID=3064203 RepID=UPI0028A48D54|nr:UPF0489 family protein [Bradyrhizobium sp. WYCCWR 12699]MDT4737058.1 UPF0489 family protein [Bradyrhizobium sp. WYCCWR 12699]